MKLCSAPALAALAALTANSALADEVHGVWKTEANDAGAYLHVAIVDCGEKICGDILRNVGGAKQEIVGRRMIKDMTPEGDGAWDGGTIWKPDTDETYDSEMVLKGDVLTVSGCVLAGLVCRSQDWTRVE